MTTIYAFHKGTKPLLVSVPHDGRLLSADIANRMSAAGLALPDTDWHVARLYRFAKRFGASMLIADYSRYVVDLNRSSDDEALYDKQWSTGLCPQKTFSGDEIYQAGRGVTPTEQAQRVMEYWRPYHEQLAATLQQIKHEHGFALLWDAHSIRGSVPSLFDGVLPDLNIGSNDGASCRADVAAAVAELAGRAPYSSVLDGRFRGGFITRHYGDPENRVCALQLEIAQRNYMDEDSLEYDRERARRLAETIEAMIDAFVAAGSKYYIA